MADVFGNLIGLFELGKFGFLIDLIKRQNKLDSAGSWKGVGT